MADIVDTAVGAGSFKTLVAAVTAAGLVETLKGAGPFTVLAPADTAFAKLPAGTVESLVKPEAKATLTGILTYHVIAGKHLAADVMKIFRHAIRQSRLERGALGRIVLLCKRQRSSLRRSAALAGGVRLDRGTWCLALRV